MADKIMIQGTMSGVGKSLLTAALCRIFRQDGHAPAPFKSQNMALNSFITADGAEIGRAQAMQAEAAGIPPSAWMNPVLLKPTTDRGSQVIVNGRVRGQMQAASYFRYKKTLFPEILQAAEALEAQHDILVIEGAGSPVELNLKQDDIVNMGLAKELKAPVLLVGDIDRGGIFAQLLGTLMLLEPEEHALVKGLIVNRFRGDSQLFRDGVRMLEERSGIPVLGVVPYIPCDIEAEDSLSDIPPARTDAAVDIAVIRLPRMSNVTDFDVFRQYPQVSVRLVSAQDMLGTPDMLLLPGTKNTISDLQWLRETGLAQEVLRCAAQGIPVMGICGGYQMLGEWISDPSGAEGGGTVRGLGLLPCETVFAEEKRQTQVTGRFCDVSGWFSYLAGAALYGYEIHHGMTETDGVPLTTCGGTVRENVCGCYVHGVFDSAEVSGRLVKKLLSQKGISFRGGIDRAAYKEQQFDILAQAVRESLDMAQVYRILKAGI